MKRKPGDPNLPAYIETFDEESKSNVTYNCIGFGIIRGINVETKEFYVLTPEPVDKLECVNLLVKGILNIPLEFYFEQDSEATTAYVSYKSPLSPSSSATAVTKTGANRHYSQQKVIGAQPVERKYLIHQNNNQSKPINSNNNNSSNNSNK